MSRHLASAIAIAIAVGAGAALADDVTPPADRGDRIDRRGN